MSASRDLILFRPSSTMTTTASRSSSLVSSRLFTAQTGTAIATELLYRIIVEIMNRLLVSLQKFASARMDQFSSYLEQRAQLRAEATQARQLETGKADGEGGGKGLRIVDEVSKAAAERGFVCPATGRDIRWGAPRGPPGPPGPPRWVAGVLEGVKEGRMQERDFWIHNLGD